MQEGKTAKISNNNKMEKTKMIRFDWFIYLFFINFSNLIHSGNMNRKMHYWLEIGINGRKKSQCFGRNFFNLNYIIKFNLEKKQKLFQ